MHLKLVLLFVIFGFANSQSTNFIDKDIKLEGFFEPSWYKVNIPFVEIPDREIEQIYYYRWSTHKRHLRYINPGAGYSVTEFVHNVWYSQKFGTLNDAAGHHIYESRWLRNPRYAEDYINYWTREGGGGNQQYSEWIADAAYSTFLLSGNREFITSQQEGFVKNFHDWYDRYEPSLNLYSISPHDDAMEHSASSEQTDDGYHGGLGYRPSFNSELYANAIAISKIARMNEDTTTADEFQARAKATRQGILENLWDDQRQFFYHMFRENNPNNELLDTREEIGFFPWRFGVPDYEDTKYDEAWKHLFDPQGFNSTYGPTTCEQRSQWFDGNQTSQCCFWNGNSWPYSTGMVINSLAAQIKHYRTTEWANVYTFLELLHKYAVTQYKDDKPYVAECHSPYRKLWVCDSFNHSEHYAHSTFVDNVLGDLLGVEPQSDNSFVINPLVPSSWAYFMLENLLYHGHNITVFYDKDGTKYNAGVGMHAYVNGVKVASQNILGKMMVTVPEPLIDEQYRRKKIENYAANVNSAAYPRVDASFTGVDVSTWQANDGRVFYDYFPSNRWTNFDSPNEVDWLSIDFGPGRKKNVDEVKVYVYSDVVTGEGVVDCPKNISVEYFNESETWVEAANQKYEPSVCIPNDVWTIQFDLVKTQKLRLVFHRNREDGWFVGITEVEVWAPWPQVEEDGVYEAEDGYIEGADIRPSDSAAGGSYVGGIDAETAFVEFNGVWVEETKEYQVNVYYANAGQVDSTIRVLVNNVYNVSMSFRPTDNGWGDFSGNTFASVILPLIRGNNVLIFSHDQGFVELDKIKVLF